MYHFPTVPRREKFEKWMYCRDKIPVQVKAWTSLAMKETLGYLHACMCLCKCPCPCTWLKLTFDSPSSDLQKSPTSEWPFHSDDTWSQREVHALSVEKSACLLCNLQAYMEHTCCTDSASPTVHYAYGWISAACIWLNKCRAELTKSSPFNNKELLVFCHNVASVHSWPTYMYMYMVL